MHTHDASSHAHSPNSPIAHDARRWFDQGTRFEFKDSAAAEAAYRQAIAADPGFEPAYTHLGAMLCAHKRSRDALALFDAALAHGNDTPPVHFNRGVALEELGRPMLAMAAYLRTLELDADYAMAHYKLGVLGDRLGDAMTALNHFNAYRRIRQATPAVDPTQAVLNG